MTDIKEWMDERVDSINGQKASKNFNNQIRTAVEERVLVYEGLDTIAEAIGVPLREEKKEELTNPYKYSLVYRGIEFCEYKEERFPGFGEEDIKDTDF